MNINPIGSITRLARKLNKNIGKMKISGMTRKLLITYILLFISIGLLYIGGILLELWKTGKFNYNAAIQYIQIYFGTTTVMTFGILGKALIDKDENGIPDVWEQELEKNKDQANNQRINAGPAPQNLNTNIPIPNNTPTVEPQKSKKGDI